ncbi:MAG: hypothetical protein DMG89_03595 [Acidobacteria bacterium]|nr:MAG: hypothetical protein DMG89_03595 [Acidobacteriota bacterium]
MNLSGSRVRFRLLPNAREALKGIVSDREFLEGFVVSESHLGVWLSLPELEPATEVILLKWEHFSTALLEYRPEAPAERLPVGFRR